MAGFPKRDGSVPDDGLGEMEEKRGRRQERDDEDQPDEDNEEDENEADDEQDDDEMGDEEKDGDVDEPVEKSLVIEDGEFFKSLGTIIDDKLDVIYKALEYLAHRDTERAKQDIILTSRVSKVFKALESQSASLESIQEDMGDVRKLAKSLGDVSPLVKAINDRDVAKIEQTVETRPKRGGTLGKDGTVLSKGDIIPGPEDTRPTGKLSAEVIAKAQSLYTEAEAFQDSKHVAIKGLSDFSAAARLGTLTTTHIETLQKGLDTAKANVKPLFSE